MSCPTCDHTLEKAADHIFHCPRCGTMVVQWAGNSRADTYVPKLVERCRGFEKNCPVMVNLEGLAWKWWRQAGIAESINVLSERKP